MESQVISALINNGALGIMVIVLIYILRRVDDRDQQRVAKIIEITQTVTVELQRSNDNQEALQNLQRQTNDLIQRGLKGGSGV